MIFKELWPGLFWAFFILILCLLPGEDIPTAWWLELISADKWIHAALFAILTLLLIKGFQQQNKSVSLRNNAIVYSVFSGAVYGLALELMQKYFLAGRTFDWFDELANCAGCLIAILLLRFFRHRLPAVLKSVNRLN